jgi:hypothetical protein
MLSIIYFKEKTHDFNGGMTQPTEDTIHEDRISRDFTFIK